MATRGPEAGSSIPDTTKEKQTNTVEQHGNQLKTLIEGVQTTNMYHLAFAVNALRKFQKAHPEYGNTLNTFAKKAEERAKQAVIDSLSNDFLEGSAYFPAEDFIQNACVILETNTHASLIQQLRTINEGNKQNLDAAEQTFKSYRTNQKATQTVTLQKPSLVYKDGKLQIIPEKDIRVLSVHEPQEAERVLAQYTTPKRYELSSKPQPYDRGSSRGGKVESLDEAIAKIKGNEESKKQILDDLLKGNPEIAEIAEIISERKLAKAEAQRKINELEAKTFTIKPKAIDLLDLKKQYTVIEASHVKEAIQIYAALHPEITPSGKIVDIAEMQKSLGLKGENVDGIVGRQTYNLLVDNLDRSDEIQA